MSADPDLLGEERAQIEAARQWIAEHLPAHCGAYRDSVEDKLCAAEALLEVPPAAFDPFWEAAVGVAFGDALAQKLMLDWITVEDDYGREAGLRWPGTTITVFPLTMVAKRVEDGEDIDIRELFEMTCVDLGGLAFSGEAE